MLSSLLIRSDVYEIFSNPGSKFRMIQEPFITSDGARALRVVGKEDMNAYIQSFKEQTDINLIIERFKLGDVAVLHSQKGMFGNFSGCPQTLSDFLNAQIQAKLLFDRLPADVRLVFDNNVDKFFVGYGSQEWLDKVSPFISSKDGVVNE